MGVYRKHITTRLCPQSFCGYTEALQQLLELSYGRFHKDQKRIQSAYAEYGSLYRR